MVWVGVEIVRGSSPHSSTWVLWYGANSSSPRSDPHQGKFFGLINVGSGLNVESSNSFSPVAQYARPEIVSLVMKFPLA